MSKTKLIIVICLVVAALGAAFQIIGAIVDRSTSSIPQIIISVAIPVGLCVALFSSKKDDTNKK